MAKREPRFTNSRSRAANRRLTAAGLAAVAFVTTVAAGCTSEPTAVDVCEITESSVLLGTPETPYHRRLHHAGRADAFDVGDTYLTTRGCENGDLKTTEVDIEN